MKSSIYRWNYLKVKGHSAAHYKEYNSVFIYFIMSENEWRKLLINIKEFPPIVYVLFTMSEEKNSRVELCIVSLELDALKTMLYTAKTTDVFSAPERISKIISENEEEIEARVEITDIILNRMYPVD